MGLRELLERGRVEVEGDDVVTVSEQTRHGRGADAASGSRDDGDSGRSVLHVVSIVKPA
jgi:hypothetical protein